MGSLFDSAVYRRSNHSPFVTPTAIGFLRDMAGMNGRASIECEGRPDVASRVWWTIRWPDAFGDECSASAQKLDLAMWRAIEKHCQSEREWKLHNAPVTEGPAAGQIERAKCDGWQDGDGI